MDVHRYEQDSQLYIHNSQLIGENWVTTSQVVLDPIHPHAANFPSVNLIVFAQCILQNVWDGRLYIVLWNIGLYICTPPMPIMLIPRTARFICDRGYAKDCIGSVGAERISSQLACSWTDIGQLAEPAWKSLRGRTRIACTTQAFRG